MGNNIVSYGDKDRLSMNEDLIRGKNFLILSMKFYGIWWKDYGNIHDQIKRHKELMYEPAYLLGKHRVNGK